MCDDHDHPPQPLDPTDVETLIGLARQTALETVAETMRGVLDAVLLDDRAERLRAVATILMKIEAEQRRPN